MRNDDLYTTLGVERTASQDEIRRVYKRLAREYHPDLNPADKGAEERFKEISAAFDVLSNPKKRQLYDEFGDEAVRVGFDPQKARAYRDWQRWGAGSRQAHGVEVEDLFGHGVGFEDLFGDLFRQRTPHRRRGPQRGQDLEAAMMVTLREAVLGGTRQITLERQGSTDPNQQVAASGRGVQLKVKVPAGIENGQTIRLAGQGAPGLGGGPAGDLLIRIEIADHPLVGRSGRDLHFDLPVSVSEAMLGAQIEVPTFYGQVLLTIPRGSQSGGRLRLRGKGMPAAQGNPSGDLFVQLVVKVPNPEQAPDEARVVAKRLDALYSSGPRDDIVI